MYINKIDILEIQAIPDLCQLFFRNAKDNFPTKAKFFHLDNDN